MIPLPPLWWALLRPKKGYSLHLSQPYWHLELALAEVAEKIRPYQQDRPQKTNEHWVADKLLDCRRVADKLLDRQWAADTLLDRQDSSQDSTASLVAVVTLVERCVSEELCQASQGTGRP